ncbi:hypothetical protein, partial [Streptomyces sp. LamerLS-31b]|uniref:hypothetical protein n=1 Tax=Streptomyces sp. LamerLS-31b TaxID=1839765 RepID=UPI0019608F6D
MCGTDFAPSGSGPAPRSGAASCSASGADGRAGTSVRAGRPVPRPSGAPTGRGFSLGGSPWLPDRHPEFPGSDT